MYWWAGLTLIKHCDITVWDFFKRLVESQISDSKNLSECFLLKFGAFMEAAETQTDKHKETFWFSVSFSRSQWTSDTFRW